MAQKPTSRLRKSPRLFKLELKATIHERRQVLIYRVHALISGFVESCQILFEFFPGHFCPFPSFLCFQNKRFLICNYFRVIDVTLTPESRQLQGDNVYYTLMYTKFVLPPINGGPELSFRPLQDFGAQTSLVKSSRNVQIVRPPRIPSLS